MNVQRGLRDKLEKYLDVSKDFEVEMSVVGPDGYDYCCFAVDGADKLSDDRYMVFYNQLASPGMEIQYTANNYGAKFTVNLAKLPATISKIVFTVNIDGNGTMGVIDSYTLTIKQGKNSVIETTLNGNDFHGEKAIIAIELYKKDVWRLAVVASGFNGGLGDLLRAYGGEEISSSDAADQPAFQSANSGKVSLEKKLERDAPKLVSLAKPLLIELDKRNLQDCVARVALVMDITGSMSRRYSDGSVQEIVNKTLPIAVQFDDNGELDFWYYGSRPRRMPPVNMKNYQTAVPNDWKELMWSLRGGNKESLVMKEVVEEYSHSQLPAYVVFITDGGVGSEGAIKRILKDASREPIFWQFVGVGGSNYGILERLDNMDGRYVDNANFFALDDFRSVSNSDLYFRLLNEFPHWLKEIKQKRMI